MPNYGYPSYPTQYPYSGQVGDIFNQPVGNWPSGSNWGQETMTETGAPNEAGAFQTAYGGLLANPNFGRVSQADSDAYFNQADAQAIGAGDEQINSMLASRGFGPNRVGAGAQLAGELRMKTALNRAYANLGMAQHGAAAQAGLAGTAAGSRYGQLTRGGTRSVTRSGFQGGQQQPGSAGAYSVGSGGLGARSSNPSGAIGATKAAPEYPGSSPPPQSPYPSGSSYGVSSGDLTNPYVSLSDRVRSGDAYNPPADQQAGYVSLSDQVRSGSPQTPEEWWKTDRGQMFSEKGWTPNDWSFLNQI